MTTQPDSQNENLKAHQQGYALGLRQRTAIDAADAARYRAWRDAMIENNGAFASAMELALPAAVGASRRPAANEWDAAIDAAAKAIKRPDCETCNDNGIVGGPSYDNPGEGGVPCPDCTSEFPERNMDRPAEQQGLFRKFDVRRVDGSDAPGKKHHNCRYFVIDMDHDPHAARALAAYAQACAATHPELSRDLLANITKGSKPYGGDPAEPRDDSDLDYLLSAATIEVRDPICPPPFPYDHGPLNINGKFIVDIPAPDAQKMPMFFSARHALAVSLGTVPDAFFTAVVRGVEQHHGITRDLSPKEDGDAEVPDRVRDALAAVLGDAMDCTRVWAAWAYGTMTQDDFSVIAEDDERLEEIARAVIMALRGKA